MVLTTHDIKNIVFISLRRHGRSIKVCHIAIVIIKNVIKITSVISITFIYINKGLLLITYHRQLIKYITIFWLWKKINWYYVSFSYQKQFANTIDMYILNWTLANAIYVYSFFRRLIHWISWKNRVRICKVCF